MPTEQKQENLRIHTIGLTEEEANASLDEHGEIDQCSLRGCSGSSVFPRWQAALCTYQGLRP